MEIILNPEEIKLGKPKDSFHYVPVVNAFIQLLEDSSFMELLERERETDKSKKDTIKDLKDGSVYQSVDFFKQNPDAFAAIFYSDGVEMVNPIGPAKTKHNVVQMFWTLADIPRGQRSKTDRFQLALVAKEKIIKKYGYKVVFKNIIKDLKQLEQGIQVFNPVSRLVKCGVLVWVADNLEAHGLGGFSSCFSSKGRGSIINNVKLMEISSLSSDLRTNLFFAFLRKREKMRLKKHIFTF